MTNNDEEYVQLEFDYEFDEKDRNTAEDQQRRDAAAELTSLGQKMFPQYYSADREELIKRIELAAHVGQPTAIELVEQAAAEAVKRTERAEQAEQAYLDSRWMAQWAELTAETAVKWAEWHIAEAAWWTDRNDATAEEYADEAAFWAKHAEKATDWAKSAEKAVKRAANVARGATDHG